jgi:regulatory protein
VRQNAVQEDTVGQAAGQKTEERAHRVSLHGLTRRNLSRWELEKLLRSRELDEDTIAAELARLERVGLIDDEALAATHVRTRHERKGLSRSALASELRGRHIAQEHIDAALAGIDGEDDRAKALELAVARARQLRSLDRQTAVRRLSGYLQRKGYSSDIVRYAVDQALADVPGTVRFS